MLSNKDRAKLGMGSRMNHKQNYSVTSRYFLEKRPETVQATHDFFDLYGGRRFCRLSFGDSEERSDVPSWELAHRLRNSISPQAIIFPDTNFFSNPMPQAVWDALFEKRVAIVPMICDEIQPWLANPHHNKAARDVIATSFATKRDSRTQLLHFDPRGSRKDRVILPELNADFLDFSYQHYFDLLSLRRLIGIELAAELGRTPTAESMTDELKRRFGDRGFLVSREAFSKGHKSNFLADEQMIVMAAITAICTGHETLILTWDTAIQEQFRKLWHLMVSDYIAYLAGELIYSSMDVNAIPELVSPGEGHPVCGRSAKAFRIPADSFREAALPPCPDPVLGICVTFGGEFRSGGQIKYLRFTPDGFCAETQMAAALHRKQTHGGKNSNRFGDCDCVVSDGGKLPDGRPAIMVSILQPPMIQCCGMTVSALDKHSCLLTREIVHEHEVSNIIVT